MDVNRIYISCANYMVVNEMNKAEIRAALMNKMVSGNWSEPIKWPNANFVTPADAMWLKFSPMFAADNMYSLKDTDVIPIILQVDIFAPKGSGNLATFNAVDKLQDLFSKHNRITLSSGFMEPVTFESREIPDDTYYRMMCEIDINAYVDRV